MFVCFLFLTTSQRSVKPLALFLSPSLRERFSHLTRVLWADSRCLWPSRARHNKVATAPASAASPRIRNSLCEVHRAGTKALLYRYYPRSLELQFDFGDTDKVIGIPGQKANYLWNHLAPCKTPRPQTRVCSTTQWLFDQRAGKYP